jgi:hypothetical protein
MKNIILTLSCKQDRGLKQITVEETWLRHWTSYHRFVLGEGVNNPHMGELIVNAPDDYSGLEAKCRAAFKWCLINDFDYAFLAAIDTYVWPIRLSAAFLGVMHEHDYVGRASDGEGHAGGGNGYWLSARAMNRIVSADLIGDYADRAHFKVLSAHGIALHNDDRYGVSITKHLGRGTGNYDPQWMVDFHEEQNPRGNRLRAPNGKAYGPGEVQPTRRRIAQVLR